MAHGLQAMAFTEGRKMALTPSYPVCMMVRPWQDATVLPIDSAGPWHARSVLTPMPKAAVPALGICLERPVRLAPDWPFSWVSDQILKPRRTP